jgi:predicted permease
LLQKALVVIQASLSLVLFVGAGLLSRTLINLERQDYKLNTANRYVIHIDTGATGYGPEQSSAFNRQLEDSISAIPGIRKVGIAIYTPLEGFSWGQHIYVQGRPKPGPEDDIVALWNRVSPGFFDSIGQPVIRGRGFTELDTSSSPLVAVVNQRFAKKFFPTEDPIGRHFGTSDQHAADYEIVGVVADIKYQHPRDPVEPIFVRPMSQWNKSLSKPDDIADEGLSLFPYAILVEFVGDPGHLEGAVSSALSQINPEVTVTYFSSFDAQVADNFTQERLVSRLTEFYGLLVLVVAAVGIYGITAYSVARRTSEIGLRIALGANRRQVVTMVLARPLWLVILGIILGVPIAVFGGHLIQSQLYNVKGYDPLTLTGAVLILIASAVVAGLIPARHAASIEPITALRSEPL